MNSKRLSCLFMTLLIILTSFVSVFADNEEPNQVEDRTRLGVDLVMGGTNNSPLSLELDKNVFYFASNIGPGDVLKSEIVFTNNEKTAVQVAVTDVINNLMDDRAAVEILDRSTLTVSLDGAPIYKGPHSQITKPVTNWIIIKPNEEVSLDIEVDIPKDLDNTFQGAEIDVSWVVEVRTASLNDVRAHIVYKDEEGNVLKRLDKKFSYDYLVTSKDIDKLEGYAIIDFKPVKAISDGQEIMVLVRRSNSLHTVNFIYKDEAGNIITKGSKKFPHNHLIEAKDIDRIEGYHILTFEQRKIIKDTNLVVTVRKGAGSGVVPKPVGPEKVEGGDKLSLYSMGLLGLAVGCLGGYYFYKNKKKSL